MESTRQSLVFTAPYQMDVVEEPMPSPASGQVLVQAQFSAISSGTEMLFYRGQVPTEGEIDSTISALAGEVRYPLRYGYAAVGQIIEVGAQVGQEWLGRTVFAFHPHTSHFVVDVADCKAVPSGMDPSLAVLLPSMETAVSLVMDGEPLIGERVAIFGQGVVGLLTACLLAQHPMEQITTVDRYPLRRQLSHQMGATVALDPQDLDAGALRDFDLTYELSGHPATLNQAIAATGFAGRVVIGSWYGAKEAPIDLGGYFHRSRIRLISSQVSTLSPSHHARWDKERRIQTAWSMLNSGSDEKLSFPQKESTAINPTFDAEPSIAAQPDLVDLVTHRFPIREATEAYRLIDEQPETLIQILLTY